MHTYKQLRAWQAADDVALEVFRWVGSNWTAALGSVHEQLRRASLSVALNIAEGFACGPGARCRSHLRIAYGSAVETTALLEFLERLGLGTGDLIERSNRTQALTYRLWQRSRTK